MVKKYFKNSKKYKDDLAGKIGSKVKESRKERGLTLTWLAEATNLSAPLISRIERGNVMPSIPSLQAIADALNMDVGHFFRNNDGKGYFVSYQAERRILASDLADEIEVLTEGGENALHMFMEPAVVTPKRMAQMKDTKAACHEGQEFMYVLEGRIELTLGAKKMRLKKGDVAYWECSLPHMAINLSKGRSRTLNVHLIPGKRTGTFYVIEVLPK